MMTGFVTVDREAVLRLIFKGTNGIEVDLQTTVDTGFSEFVSLPQSWIDAMALPFARYNNVTLADGSNVQVAVYFGVVVWDGQDKPVEVHCMEGDPLVGMSLMLDFLLTLPVRIGETFSIASIP